MNRNELLFCQKERIPVYWQGIRIDRIISVCASWDPDPWAWVDDEFGSRLRLAISELSHDAVRLFD